MHVIKKYGVGEVLREKDDPRTDQATTIDREALAKELRDDEED